MSKLEKQALTRLGLSMSYEPIDSKWVPIEVAQKIDQVLAQKMADLQQLTHDIDELEGLKNNWKRHAEDEQHERILLSQKVEAYQKWLFDDEAYSTFETRGKFEEIFCKTATNNSNKTEVEQ